MVYENISFCVSSSCEILLIHKFKFNSSQATCPDAAIPIRVLLKDSSSSTSDWCN